MTKMCNMMSIRDTAITMYIAAVLTIAENWKPIWHKNVIHEYT